MYISSRTPTSPEAVTVLWACLLLIHQRNSVWVVNGERRSIEKGVDVQWGVRFRAAEKEGV